MMKREHGRIAVDVETYPDYCNIIIESWNLSKDIQRTLIDLVPEYLDRVDIYDDYAINDITDSNELASLSKRVKAGEVGLSYISLEQSANNVYDINFVWEIHTKEVDPLILRKMPEAYTAVYVCFTEAKSFLKILGPDGNDLNNLSVSKLDEFIPRLIASLINGKTLCVVQDYDIMEVEL